MVERWRQISLIKNDPTGLGCEPHKGFTIECDVLGDDSAFFGVKSDRGGDLSLEGVANVPCTTTTGG